MPKKIKIEDIIKKLPPFVKIIEESYRGTRYNCDFIDTEYNEKFTANVRSVIRLQHGGKTRTNKRKSESGKKSQRERAGVAKITPLEKVKERLPDFLRIVDSTYRGMRHKATFFDVEYNLEFEAIVGNLIRGKGFCKERFSDEFRKKITIPVDEIESRLFNIYGDKIKIIKETYINTNSRAKFIIQGSSIPVSCSVSSMLRGVYFTRQDVTRWRMRVLVRDNFLCQKCGEDNRPAAHHITPWSKSVELRFDVDNGITLCNSCHNRYHGLYKDEECRENFERWLRESRN